MAVSTLIRESCERSAVQHFRDVTYRVLDLTRSGEPCSQPHLRELLAGRESDDRCGHLGCAARVWGQGGGYGARQEGEGSGLSPTLPPGFYSLLIAECSMLVIEDGSSVRTGHGPDQSAIRNDLPAPMGPRWPERLNTSAWSPQGRSRFAELMWAREQVEGQARKVLEGPLLAALAATRRRVHTWQRVGIGADGNCTSERS